MKMRPIHLVIIIVIIIICAMVINYVYIGMVKESKENKTIQGNKTIENIEIGTSKYNDHLDLDNRHIRLYNNIWGALGKELNNKNLKLYVYYKSDDNFGWEWDRPDPSPGKYVTPVYSEAIIGAIPTQTYYTTDIFPIRYGDIKDWKSEIEFQYIKPPTGRYNLAYDIYWMEGKTKKFNIMIWVAGHHDEKPVGIVSDGINEYIHYHRGPGKGQYWDFHLFELKNQNVTNVKIDIKKLLDTIRDDNIDDNWIIPGMELGSEIFRGSGRIEINKYMIDLNGNTLG